MKSEKNKLSFPLSQVNRFKSGVKDNGLNGLRYGQAFYDYMHLDKCTQDREFLNTLYYADQATAIKIIDSLTDPVS